MIPVSYRPIAFPTRRVPVLAPPSRRVNFYIVFHRDVNPDNTREYTPEEMQNKFTWVAVNEALPKALPSGVPLLEEYKLPVYVPALQANHFYQNSVFLHLYWNPELLTSEYVGFGQYDMEFDKQAFDRTLGSLNGTSNVVVGFYPADFKTCPQVYDSRMWDRLFLDPYNRFHSTRHTWDTIANHPLCLYHTFILPRDVYVHMMQFVESILPSLLTNVGYNTRHLAGTLERLFGFYISCALEEGRLRFQKGEGILHRDEQRLDDPFRHIVGRTVYADPSRSE